MMIQQLLPTQRLGIKLDKQLEGDKMHDHMITQELEGGASNLTLF